VDYFDGPTDDTMLIDHIHDVERDENEEFPVPGAPDMPDILSLFRYNSVNYSPSSDGAIDTLDFKLNYRTTAPLSSLKQSANLQILLNSGLFKLRTDVSCGHLKRAVQPTMS
jgi:hypothetical protein